MRFNVLLGSDAFGYGDHYLLYSTRVATRVLLKQAISAIKQALRVI